MGKNSTTTTTSEPPAWARPLFEQSGSETKRIYDTFDGRVQTGVDAQGKPIYKNVDPIGFNSWQGDTVADPSAQTQQGIQGLIGTANQGAALGQNPMALTNQMLSSGGLSSDAQRGISSLYNSASAGGMAGAGQDTAQKYLTGMAEGDMLKGSPFFNAALKDQTDRTADQVNLSMAGSGRYGSGAHTGTLTDAIGEMRTRALHENYGRERGHQMEAIRGLTDADQSKFSNRLQAIQTGAGLEQQGAQTGLGYINALPTVQQNRVFDDQLRLQAGGMLDQQKQADLNNQIRKFTEKDMEEITRLGFLQSAAGGSAGPYGTTHQATQQPFNPLSLLSMFGLFM